MPEKQVEIRLGALTPKISEQLSAQGLRFKPHTDEVKIQKLADSITMLKIHGITPESEYRNMHRRLLKKIFLLVEVAS